MRLRRRSHTLMGLHSLKKESFESETVKKKRFVFIFRMETKRKTNLKLKSIIHFRESVCKKESERKMELQTNVML